MRLIVIHNHLRAGGVRRVIELGVPCIVRAFAPNMREVVLVSGEEADPRWLANLERVLQPVQLSCYIEPAVLYMAEQKSSPATLRRRLKAFFSGLFGAPGAPASFVWAHNQGLGRNLLLTEALEQSCATHRVPLVLHHHDWWFDNRWERWKEMRRSGFGRLSKVAHTLLAESPQVKHAAINHTDFSILEKHFGSHAGWLPNPAGGAVKVSRQAGKRAAAWVAGQLGTRAPYWLLPCRLLRRKNVAEALLLVRWLRPEAWLVTTAGASSADETSYAEALGRAARQENWPLRLSILEKAAADAPSVSELISASEAIMLTSLQEGFGLPYLEAARAGRPLICRALPNVMPDMERFGLHFEQAYQEVLIAPGLFDWKREVSRQKRLYNTWRKSIPAPARKLAQKPVLLSLAQPGPVPFSRLTLSAQLEVLRQPVDESWSQCMPLNSFLQDWRTRAARGALVKSTWPATADRHLGDAAYGHRFRDLVESAVSRLPKAAPIQAQMEFFRERLASDNLYPLSWSSKT